MFYENKYSRWYFSMIEKAKCRDSVEGEVHHIIPRSIGGTEDSSNLVLLTYREHYVAHALLVRMHSSTKLVHAFWGMSFMNEKKYYNSRLYADAKKRYVAVISGDSHWMKSEEARNRVSADWDEDRRKKFRESVSGDKHWTKNSDRTEHAKKMRSKLSREILVENGKKSVFATNNPMKNPEFAARYKKPKEKVVCPHCGKSGGKPVMMRYHFDMCKEIK